MQAATTSWTILAFRGLDSSLVGPFAAMIYLQHSGARVQDSANVAPAPAFPDVNFHAQDCNPATCSDFVDESDFAHRNGQGVAGVA